MDAYLIAATLGAVLGSFANVLIDRLPRGESVVVGRSHCDHCARIIAWYDLVPVGSWLALCGRCRHCRARITWTYPVLELAVALIAVACVWRLGFTIAAMRMFLLGYVLLVIAVIDWRDMIIPHTLSIGGTLCGYVLSPFAGPGLLTSAIGHAAGSGLVLALQLGYFAARRRAGMGGGDVMLMGLVGCFLGPWRAGGVLLLGAVLGTIWALVSTGGRPRRFARLPFGTFLALAAVLVEIFGDAVWRWYVGMW